MSALSKINFNIEDLIKWPNLLTLSRGFAAFGFLFENNSIRLLAVIWAIISDILDGYLARKMHLDNPLGAALDPIVDKFFMFFALAVLLREQKMGSYELLALFARDITIAIFGLYLVITGYWCRYQLKAPFLGKIFTALQFTLLFGICIDIQLPRVAYSLLLMLGLLLLVELGFSLRPAKR